MKQETEELKREHILALDIATHCGYFSVHESGTWNFTEGKRRNGNKTAPGSESTRQLLSVSTAYKEL